MKQKEGFTLLEIMIALAIIGLTLITVLHTANYHADLSHENTMLTQMVQMAKEKLFELEENPVSSSGSLEGTGFTYENVVSETDVPGIIELKTTLKGKDREVVLNELVRGRVSQKQ